MKKRVLILALAMMVVLAGCKKKEETPAVAPVEPAKEVKEEVVEEAKEYELKPGAYSMEYEEEFADGVETFTSYIFLAEDGSGFFIAQDDVLAKWSKTELKTEDGGSYPIKMIDEDTLSLDRGFETPEEYAYIGKELPEEVVDHMRYFMDGTLKVNNIEAGFAFEDLITSDKINFYSLSSQVEYTAESDDLLEMTAAYMELTDKNLPVLFVKTPKAPQAVGKEHALQYVDGKIYNIVGFDKIDAVYKNSAVIISSINEEDKGETVYYFKPDSDNELYFFASKNTKDGNVTCKLFSGTGDASEVSEDDLNKAVEEAVAGDEPVEEINWKALDRVF